MASTDDTGERMRLSESLWELRCGIARWGDASANQVSFGRMLTDPGYRARVIHAVRQSESPELRGLADDAHRHNSGRLAESPVSWDAAGRTELDIEELTRDTGRLHDRRAPVPVAGAAATVMLVAVLGGIAGYLFSDRVVAMIVGHHRLAGVIDDSRTLDSGRTYVLEGITYVTKGATLTIERGARILGEPGSALVITRDGDIQVQGTRSDPVVFTSAQPEGRRARGDWGGLVLLGNAPVNQSDAHVEGIPENDARGDFGGADPNSSCGVLKHTRIEFAGHEIAANVELNGLTLGGCGRGTIVRNVQVHMGLDDGVEVFGGTANLERVVVTRAGDDSLDWDLGWTGNAQFIVLQQQPATGDHAIEADNNRDDQDAKPRSAPILSNVTLVGAGNAGDQRAILLRRGTGADLRNVLATNFPAGILHIRGRASAALADSGRLRVAGLIAHDFSGSDTARTRAESDDRGFDERSLLRASESRVATDPALPPAASDLRTPVFVPHAGSPAARGSAPIPRGEFWDRRARYIGAVEPGAQGSWLDGWTAFPAH